MLQKVGSPLISWESPSNLWQKLKMSTTGRPLLGLYTGAFSNLHALNSHLGNLLRQQFLGPALTQVPFSKSGVGAESMHFSQAQRALTQLQGPRVERYGSSLYSLSVSGELLHPT